MLDKQARMVDKLNAYGRFAVGTVITYNATIKLLKTMTVGDVVKFGRLTSVTAQSVAEFSVSLPSLLMTSILLGYIGWRFNNSYECFLQFGIIGGIPRDMVKNRYGSDLAFNKVADENRKEADRRCNQAQCGQEQVSGGQAGDRRTIKLTATKGKVSISYDMKPVPDRLQVIYEGKTLLDTGFVSGTGSRSFDFEGNSNEMTVIVTGNPSKSTTQWNYQLSCPQ